MSGLEGSSPAGLHSLQEFLLPYVPAISMFLWALWLLVLLTAVVQIFLNEDSRFLWTRVLYVVRWVASVWSRSSQLRFIVVGVVIGILGTMLLALLGIKNELGDQNTRRQSVLASKLFRDGEHYRGERDAEVVVVEYAETECPWCKEMHYILRALVAEYEGKVVWVYRHFPLEIHPKSAIEAVALECAAEIGGEEAFWRYLDEIFRMTPSNDRLDLALLPVIAERIGISPSDHTGCVSSGRHRDKVQSDRDSGILWEVGRVPHFIVIAPNGEEYPISGSRPIEFMRGVIAHALTKRTNHE